MRSLVSIDEYPHAPVWAVASTFEINEGALSGSAAVDTDGAFRMRMPPIADEALYARCRDITGGSGEVLMTARIRDWISARKSFVRMGIVVGTGSYPSRAVQFFGLTTLDNGNVALTGDRFSDDLLTYAAGIGTGIDLASRGPVTLRLRWTSGTTYLELMRGETVIWSHGSYGASRPTFAGVAIGNENVAGNTSMPVVAAFDQIALAWS